MQEELQALEKNHTWNLTKEARPISSKEIYKIKRNVDGLVAKYKARLVVQGYLQIYEVDFNESFAQFAKVVIIRIMLSVAAHYF